MTDKGELHTTAIPGLSLFQRLIDLLAEQQDIPILAPIIQREIIYRLLVGDQGTRLRQIASAGSQSHQISRAIDWLKSNYTNHLRIDDLARQVNMSVSTFHHHFRALTAMSPLQFQKRLRLNEARRLMLFEPLDATTAAFQVGYESTSQFSREYSRLFGAPPLRADAHAIAAPISATIGETLPDSHCFTVNSFFLIFRHVLKWSLNRTAVFIRQYDYRDPTPGVSPQWFGAEKLPPFPDRARLRKWHRPRL